MEEFAEYWQIFPELKKALFEEQSAEHTCIKEGEIKDIIGSHFDVFAFKERYFAALSGFDAKLSIHLVKGMQSLNISKEETTLNDEIFNWLESITLIDKYKVYRLFYNELADLKEKKEKLTQTSAEYQEIFDSLTEEDKENLTNILNDDNTVFLLGPMNKVAKELLKASQVTHYPEDSSERKLLAAKNLLDEEKELKRIIKKDAANLHLLTKETIEKLTDEQVYSLLEKKWIVPLMAGLQQLPVALLENFDAKVQALADKYSTTLSDVEDEIAKTQSNLSAIIYRPSDSDEDMLGLTEFKILLGGE